MPRTGKHGRKTGNVPVPKSIHTAFKLNENRFEWSFRRAFWEHDGWKPCHEPRFFAEHIIEKLKHLEKQTWQEVLNASGGKSEGHGNNNHFISAKDLPKAERREFIRFDYLRRYDKIFSLRLSGSERLIGIVDMNRFDILWYDANHTFF